MQQLSGAFRSFPEVSRRYQGGTQGSVPVPADAACAQMFPFLAHAAPRHGLKPAALSSRVSAAARSVSAARACAGVRNRAHRAAGPRGGRGHGAGVRRGAAGAARGRSVRWSLGLARASFWQIRQNVVRFRLYRHRFLQENMRFAAFFKIYQIIKLNFLKFGKILQILRHLQIVS